MTTLLLGASNNATHILLSAEPLSSLMELVCANGHDRQPGHPGGRVDGMSRHNDKKKGGILA